MRNSSLKHTGMSHVNKGSHSFYLPPTHLSTSGMSHFTPQLQSVTALWLVLIFHPIEYHWVSGRVGLSGWLQTEVVYPPADSLHPSTNWARR